MFFTGLDTEIAMPLIDIDNVVEYMRISEDIQGPGGGILLRKGMELTGGMIRTLKTRGVKILPVDSDDPDLAYMESVAPDASDEEIEARFADVRGDVVMEELLTAAKEYFAAKRTGHGE